MDDYDSRIQQIAERTLSAKFGLWSALLTAHTVLLSVAVALLVVVKPPEAWRFKLCGFIAIVCIVVLLLNFALAKSQYELIGQRLVNAETELSESERNRDLRNASLRRNLSVISESIVILGLSVNVMVLGWVLAAS